MQELELFGLSLNVDEIGVVSPPRLPHLTVRAWQAQLDDTRLQIEAHLIVGGVSTVHVKLDLITETSGRLIRPKAGPQPQVPEAACRIWHRVLSRIPNDARLTTESGTLRLTTIAFPTDGVQARNGGELVFRHRAHDAVVESRSLPLSVRVDEGAFSLELGRGLVVFHEACFQAVARVVANTAARPAPRPRSFFVRNHHSLAVSFAMTDAAKTRSFQFAQDDPEPLPLHADLDQRGLLASGENPLRSPLTVTGYCLNVALTDSPLRQPILQRLTLSRGEARPFQLASHALARADNRAQVWTVNGVLDLKLRLFDDAKPSTLLISSQGSSLVRLQAAKAEALHGPIDMTTVRTPRDALLRCYLDEVEPGVDPELNRAEPNMCRATTLPWLEFPSTSRLVHPRSGLVYQKGSAQVDHLTFDGSRSALPLLHRQFIEHASGLKQPHYEELNRAFTDFSHTLQLATHRTLMGERPKPQHETVTIERAFVANETARENESRLDAPSRIATHTYPVIRDYGPIRVHMEVNQQKPPDYVVIHENTAAAHFEGRFDFPLDPGHDYFKLGGPPQNAHGRPLGIVILTTRYSIAQIFAMEGIPDQLSDSDEQSFLNDILDPTVAAQGWTGLLLFHLALDFREFKILDQLVAGDLHLAYLALTPQKDAQFSATGRVLWNNREAPFVPPGEDDSLEVMFRLNRVDIAWRDRKLTRFHTDADATFHKILGLRNPPADSEGAIKLKILGSYDQNNGEIRFLGQLTQKLPIFSPEDDFGPIQQIFISRAEIKASKDKVTLMLDGELVLKSIPLGSIDIDISGIEVVRFKGLGIVFKDTSLNNRPFWLSLSYPSIKLDLDARHFHLFDLDALQLKIRAIGVDFGGDFDWNGLVPLLSNDFDQRALHMVFRLKLMRLPALAAKAFDRLLFDFSLGLSHGSGSWSRDKFRLSLKALGFEKLHLDLMRFLEIRAEGLEITAKTFPPDTRRVPWFDLENARIFILEHKVVDELTLSLFTLPNGESGFLGFLGEPFKNSWFEVEWALVGKNLVIPTELATQILAIDKLEDQGSQIRAGIKQAADANQLIPLSLTDDKQPVGEWLFAGGLKILDGFLAGKFLFQDNAYYGMALWGKMFEEWFGYEFAISVLYVKGPRPEEDLFHLEVTMPRVTLPAFTFFGGVMAIDIGVNGSFMLDVGFPWLLPNGARMWHRTLGAIVGFFQGSGGFYITKRSLVRQQNEFLYVAGGYALQAGLGASFGGGGLTVWVRAGIYTIIEGTVVLKRGGGGIGDLAGLKLSGALGILVQGAGELNWWIISVRIQVTASAEARITLLWRMNADGTVITNGSNRARIALDFNLHASASARACLGSGWFKVCKGISVSVSMPFHHELEL